MTCFDCSTVIFKLISVYEFFNLKLVFIILVTGVKLVVIGVGKDVSNDDLNVIAPPSTGDTAIVRVNSTDDMDPIIPTLVNVIVDVTGMRCCIFNRISNGQ